MNSLKEDIEEFLRNGGDSPLRNRVASSLPQSIDSSARLALKGRDSRFELLVQKARDQFIKTINHTPISQRQKKLIEGTGGKVSVSDLIAYQIGWGKCLIRWYEAGIEGKVSEMPGEGFSKWDYVAIAKHFYQKYAYDAADEQLKIFQKTATQILEITQKEHQTGNLDREGVWPWCTLASGKKWPLSKWIQVNTVAPYKRAIQLIKKLVY